MRDTQPPWAELTLALDPWRQLQPGDEMDRLYVPAPYSAADRFVQRLRAWHRTAKSAAESAPAPKFLFCGARGSGKTTQLRRLLDRLRGDWEVLFVDLAPVLPEKAGTLQLVAHMGVAIIARLAQWEGADDGVARVLRSEEQATGGFASALGEFVGEFDLASLVEAIGPLLLAADVSSGVVTSAVAGTRAAWPTLKKRLDPVQQMARAERLMRRLSGSELGAAEALVQQVSRLASALHGRARKPVVLLVDGVDKTLRLEDVLLAFDDIDMLRNFDASVVLTGPSNLRHDVRFAGMRQDLTPLVHNNFPVVDAEGRERSEGMDAMLAILKARLGGALAGSVDTNAARIAARYSSGMPREFLRILWDASLRAEDASERSITEESVVAAAKELRLTLQQPLTRSDLLLLETIRTSRRIGNDAREQELLYENFIACYPNDDAYFRPHELLVEWVEKEGARVAPDADPVA